MTDDIWRIIDDVIFIIGDTRDIIDEGPSATCGTQDIDGGILGVIDVPESVDHTTWHIIDVRQSVSDGS